MNSLESLSQLIKQRRKDTEQSISSLASLLKIRPDLIVMFETEIKRDISFYHFSHLKRLCQILNIQFEQYQRHLNTEFNLSGRQRQIPQISLYNKRRSSYLNYWVITLLFLVAGTLITIQYKLSKNQITHAVSTADHPATINDTSDSRSPSDLTHDKIKMLAIEPLPVVKSHPHNILDS